MTISLQWLKQFIDIPYSIEELDSVLTMLGLEVEKVHNADAQLEKFVIGKVLEREKHPDADKLSVCKVFDGSQERQIICGAPNVAAGQTVAVALPGAIVPNGGFEIGKRKIRGVESVGMICSKAELNLGEDTGGIWELPTDTPIGMPLAQYLGMDDTVIEIGITPNRADCLSHIGIAREIAVRTRGTLRLPNTTVSEAGSLVESSVDIVIENPQLCPRYAARVVRNVSVTESPDWLKQRLESLGLRPRNVIVDITNLVLMECGQPLHAFDLDTITDKKIIVKTAEDSQKFVTLDSKERILDSSMLMINDNVRPIAIAGVMGGENSEISERTTSVLIESAYFYPSSIRSTAKKLGISSDASYRFERGVDPEKIIYAVNRAAQLMAELAGGTVEKGIIDIYPNPIVPKTIVLRYAQIPRILGITVPDSTVEEYLVLLGFIVKEKTADALTVTAPTWRVDMEQEIDLIEEIARIYNYDNILPDVSATFPADASIVQQFSSPKRRNSLKQYLTARGLQEIVTYTFTDPTTAELTTENPIVLANALGEEFSAMRSSLIPSMLKVIDRNCRNGQNSLALFDCGKKFSVANNREKTVLSGISEKEELCIALTGDYIPQHWVEKQRKADFYDIKGIVEEILFDCLRLNGVSLIPAENDSVFFGANRMDIIAHKRIIGTVGEIDKNTLKKFGIDQVVVAASLNLTDIYLHPEKKVQYKTPSPFPFVRRDAAFTVTNDVQADELLRAAYGVNNPLLKEAGIFDVFTGESVGKDKKSIALSFVFGSDERTLIEQEIQESFQEIIEAVESGTGASLRQ